MSKTLPRDNSYRQIFKATSIFGGVQAFNIIITIIRSKLVAVLLGPSGMGIVGLLTTTTNFISAITNFGLSTSAVKNVSAAYATGDSYKLGSTVAVFRKLVWLTGLLGFLLTLILAPWLSKITFGDRSYTLAFIAISITLLLSQISSGQGVVLRGTRRVKSMARSSMIGAVLGLIISIPLYYFFSEKGIVPAIILTSISALLLTWYFARQVEIQNVKVAWASALRDGKEMLRLGFFISLSGLIALGVSYVVRLFISNNGGVAEVGLYNAGFAIVNTYVGMVFTAMGSDYYPRLAAVAHDTLKSNQEINQQAEISLLILAPILMVLLVFVNLGVLLLYSEKFMPINTMIHWAALGIFFKVISWSIGFLMLAKGASKLFFWNEMFSNTHVLILNILGYKMFGLTGLGVSYCASYLIALLQAYFITRKYFSFTMGKALQKIFLYQFTLALLCFVIVQRFDNIYSYLFGTVLIIASAIISYKELDKRLAIKSIIRKVLKK